MVTVFVSLLGGQNVDFLDPVHMSRTKFCLQGPVTRWRLEDVCTDNLSDRLRISQGSWNAEYLGLFH